MTKIPHPFPYQGSKRNLASHILKFIPENIDRFVEPFCGSSAISLAVASSRKCGAFWLNDINIPLMNLWGEILATPEKVASGYGSLWNMQLGNEQDFYNRIRSEFNKTGDPISLLYLLARCVKAAIRYNSKGEFNNSPDKRRRGMCPDKMLVNISQTALLLKDKTMLTSEDYRLVLDQCNPPDIVYMDPPYQGVCKHRNSRYCLGIEHDEFCHSLAKLVKKNVKFLVSYDGRCGNHVYGKSLPNDLGMLHIELCAGRSSQATLLGKNEKTIESLYISPSLKKDHLIE